MAPRGAAVGAAVLPDLAHDIAAGIQRVPCSQITGTKTGGLAPGLGGKPTLLTRQDDGALPGGARTPTESVRTRETRRHARSAGLVPAWNRAAR